MKNKLNELIKQYTGNRYAVSTGSYEWRDAKSNFEIIDDAIIGSVAHYDNGSIEINEYANFKLNLEVFKTKVENYKPKDDEEAIEKNAIINKINIAFQIYEIIFKK